MSEKVSLFESVGLQEITGNNQLVHELVKDPFYKHGPHYFVNADWILVEIENDFFIETHTWKILQKLMKLNRETYCLLYDAHAYITKTTYAALNYDVNIDKLRDAMEENGLYVIDWAFISVSKKWACLSMYDSSALFIGYDSIYNYELADLVKENSDFVKFI